MFHTYLMIWFKMLKKRSTEVTDWFTKKNGMKANPHKHQASLLGTKPHSPTSLAIKDVVLSCQNSVQQPGINIDAASSFHEHANFISHKVIGQVSALMTWHSVLDLMLRRLHISHLCSAILFHQTLAE